MNDFHVTAPVHRAEFRGTDLSNVTGFAEIRVADMRSGIGLRDSHLRTAMRADSFALIRFELVGIDPGTARGDTIPVVFQGNLTIKGVTKTIRAPGTVVLHAITGGAEVTTTFAIDIREYGIRPPSRFLGAVRVDPLVPVVVRLSFGG